VLVNAITATAGWLKAAASSPRGRQAETLSVARWFETYRLTERVPVLPDLSGELASRLASVLRGDEIQAAVQELLAARLTDAPEDDARRVREAFGLTLVRAAPELALVAGGLADYYDDEICDLVGRLGESPLLAFCRSEASSHWRTHGTHSTGRMGGRGRASRPDQGPHQHRWRTTGLRVPAGRTPPPFRGGPK